MNEEVGSIKGYFFLEEGNIDQFLEKYYDETGKCKIKGIKYTKSEITSMMQEIVKENRQIAIKKLKFIKDKAQKEQWKLDELNYVISMFEKRLKDKSMIDGFSALRLTIKLDIFDLDNDTIKSIITKGYYEMNDPLIDIISLDTEYYGLNIMSEEKILELESITGIKLKKDNIVAHKNDQEKREKMINDILNYKKSVLGNQY